MSKENNIVEYGPSELGTKEYWDSLYDRENKNFQENGDIGEIWYLLVKSWIFFFQLKYIFKC
jgi:hypothetical protein